ncbi:TPA: hypothetical protein N0F65_001080 [Lagenidium giganteum]|uniref:Ubiquitin-like modifier-activating enzyme 5 n=1 Tax=Lagenidium giganteum TaxID=4803 RepID=A0AAV2YIQ2_9STRA|nr:TPA: hypothetical protein N0F65_011502 [Lagenidium giganteum]DAZ93945.1 TPA: hypothetical protein N0F65_001080 [Lagenidium giganteum]
MDYDAFFDDGPPISQLQAAVKALDEYVHHVVPAHISSTAPASTAASLASTSTTAPVAATTPAPASVPPPVPHGRRSSITPVHLFARQEFAVGKWKELAKAHVAICGVGAIGALAAESLVRAGVGKLFLVDPVRVQMSAMSSMVYLPQEIGFSRIQALRLRLQSISAHGKTTIDSFSADLSNEMDLLELRKKLRVSSVGATKPNSTGVQWTTPAEGSFGLFEALTSKRPYDLVLCCVESEEATEQVNEICLELSLPMLHVTLSPCNTKVSLEAVLPGHTCCLTCVRTQQQLTQQSTLTDEVVRSIAKAFPAALPHVELTAAGLLAQNAIKFLLELGDFVPFFTLDLLKFEMESYSYPPNPACTNAACKQRQHEERKHTALSSSA